MVKAFRDRAKAEEYLQTCIAADANDDPYDSAMVRHPRMTWMTDVQIAFAEQALTVLSGIEEIPYNRVDAEPFLEAVEEYVINKAKRDEQVRKSLSDAIAIFKSEKKADGCRDAYLSPLGYRLDASAKKIGACFVFEINTQQISDYLYTIENLTTRQSVRGNLCAFFNWCIVKNFCAESPVDKSKAVKIAQKEPDILPIASVKNMLKFAATHRSGKALSYVVLMLFCGLRREEAHKMTWKYIDLLEGHIKLDATITKLKNRRVSQIPQNAMEWLKLCDRKNKIDPGRRAEDNAKRAAGFFVDSGGFKNDSTLPPWQADGLRHTCLSYRLSQTSDAASTAHWAGNSEDVLLKRYFGLVTRKQTEEFWNITPESLEIKPALVKP